MSAEACSKRGLVTSPHPLASEAGRAVLAAGGNAIEAALAMAAVLCVVAPHFTGLGGDAFWMITEPGGAVRALSGIGQAPQRCPLLAGPIALRGPAATLTSAAAVDSWGRAFDFSQDHWQGHCSWAALLAPAIVHAQEGVAVSASQRFWREQRAAETSSWPGFDATFPAQAHTLSQPRLAETLVTLAEQGPRTFYEGELAARLAAGLQAVGSPLSADDLRRTAARWETPLRVPYRDGELLTLPPPTQGLTTLQAMAMLGHFDIAALGEGSAEHFHLMVEAIKQAFMDRDRHIADPDQVDVPVQRLLDPPYLAAQARRIDPLRALPWPQPYRHGDTVYLGAVDAAGRGVSLLQTIYFDWGSGVVVGDTGVLWHNRGAAFHHDPSHHNALRPGARPFHTLNPGVYLQQGRPRLLYGTQGADGQPQTLVALLTRLIDFGLAPHEALARPRFLLGRTFSDSRDSLKLEAHAGEPVMQALRRRGHEVVPIPAYSPLAGQPGVIRIDADGTCRGAHDRRGEGRALGV